jgi:hypothetical protein
MDAADSKRRLISEADLRLMRRAAVVLAAIFIFVFAFSRLEWLFGRKFYDVTGAATWIWPKHEISRDIPVAFFATKEFDLAPNRSFTRVKILGDPEYTLYFNGTEVGGRRVGDDRALDVYDVSKLARDKRNRMVVAVRSANGVGGLIAAIDETDDFKNAIVTGKDWHIVRSWASDLLIRDPPPTEIETPMLLGRPPERRWNYLELRPGVPAHPITRVVAQRETFLLKTALADVNVIEGVAVRVKRPARATVYDFGPVAGRLRLTSTYFSGAARVVNVRFANTPAELGAVEGSVDHFVFAAGEKQIIDPEERHFRYAMVFSGQATAEVVQ